MSTPSSKKGQLNILKARVDRRRIHAPSRNLEKVPKKWSMNAAIAQVLAARAFF